MKYLAELLKIDEMSEYDLLQVRSQRVNRFELAFQKLKDRAPDYAKACSACDELVYRLSCGKFIPGSVEYQKLLIQKDNLLKKIEQFENELVAKKYIKTGYYTVFDDDEKAFGPCFDSSGLSYMKNKEKLRKKLKASYIKKLGLYSRSPLYQEADIKADRKKFYDLFKKYIFNLLSLADKPVLDGKNKDLYSKIIIKIEYLIQKMEQNWLLAQKYVQDFDKNQLPVKKNLYIYGKVGSGKTYMASAIVKALLDRNKIVLSLSADDIELLCQEYRINRDSFKGNYEAYDKAVSDFNVLSEVEVLYIDDFASYAIDLHTQHLLLKVLKDRIIKGKVTIISSNYSLNSLLEENLGFSERDISRLKQAYTEIKFEGEDFRKINIPSGE